MKKRTFPEMVHHFYTTVSQIDMPLKDRMTLLGIIVAMEQKYEEDVADVVPVVRCKDCKHRDPEDKKCDSGHFIQWQLPRDDDWFCADGEKVTE